MQQPRQPRAGIPSFEAKLENEEEVVDAILVALSKGQLDAGVWDDLHKAAVRDDRVSELAFAYESTAQGRKLKTFLPAVQAELYFRAATFFGDVLGDEFGATTYLERALGAQPGHHGAFERIDAQLTRVDDNKKLAELCAQTASHRPRPEQIVLLKRAAVLFERAGLEDKSIETYQQLVKLDPSDESLRDALEARYVKANRYRDVARMLEQALAASDPAADPDGASRVRAKLIELFANQR
jgi:tetratricopeptide (TPR) repeat protein